MWRRWAPRHWKKESNGASPPNPQSLTTSIMDGTRFQYMTVTRLSRTIGAVITMTPSPTSTGGALSRAGMMPTTHQTTRFRQASISQSGMIYRTRIRLIQIRSATPMKSSGKSTVTTSEKNSSDGITTRAQIAMRPASITNRI